MNTGRLQRVPREQLRPQGTLPPWIPSPGHLLPSSPVDLSKPFKTQNWQPVNSNLILVCKTNNWKEETNTVVMVPIFFSQIISVVTKLKNWIPLRFKKIFLSKVSASSSRQSRNWGTWSWALSTFSSLRLMGRSTVLELVIHIFSLE